MGAKVKLLGISKNFAILHAWGRRNLRRDRVRGEEVRETHLIHFPQLLHFTFSILRFYGFKA